MGFASRQCLESFGTFARSSGKRDGRGTSFRKGSSTALGAISTIFKPKGREKLLALMTGEPLDTPSNGDDDDAADGGPDVDLFVDMQARSKELIGNALAQLDGYQMQDLVA